MVEANHSLQQVALWARLARAAITLAQREAEKHVKRSIAARGIKPALVARREIFRAARDYSLRTPS